MNEEDQLKFGFDLLDPTKIVPEELVPITKLGKMTLNRNPVNYFAETEQVMVGSGRTVQRELFLTCNSFNRHTLFAASTSVTIHSYKDESSPTSILS
jgi:hypothetical protein